jgi:hypothetical protein
MLRILMIGHIVAEAFWRAHLGKDAENLLGASGPHMVLDLYSDQRELRLLL